MRKAAPADRLLFEMIISGLDGGQRVVKAIVNNVDMTFCEIDQGGIGAQIRAATAWLLEE
jgi:hypothetical protein